MRPRKWCKVFHMCIFSALLLLFLTIHLLSQLQAKAMQAADGKARDVGPRHEKHANQMQKLLEERAKSIEELQKREEELRATRDKVP